MDRERAAGAAAEVEDGGHLAAPRRGREEVVREREGAEEPEPHRHLGKVSGADRPRREGGFIR